MLSKLFLLLFINYIYAFFNPSIKLESGRYISIAGTGPPIFFSPGLFGTMPSNLYSNLINIIKKNNTIITLNDNNPVKKTDITNIVNSLNVDSISYFSHSSFFPEVLESNYINSAILIDPICLPKLDITGINNPSIYVEYPIYIIRAEKLYNTDVSIPDWQEPEIIGNIIDETFPNVGHPDILDDTWANLAKRFGFWETTDNNIISFKKWKYNNNNNDIKIIRQNYRKFVSYKINSLLKSI